MMVLSRWSLCAALAPFPLLIAAVALGAILGEEHLPGSRVSLQEAIRSSQTIAVVRVVDMGKLSPNVSAGKRWYPRVKLSVVKTLKGDAQREIYPVRVTLITLAKAKETAPDRDEEYLFFLKSPPITAVKILRADAENVRATMEAIKGMGKES
jgi:hypothetical protein